MGDVNGDGYDDIGAEGIQRAPHFGDSESSPYLQRQMAGLFLGGSRAELDFIVPNAIFEVPLPHRPDSDSTQNVQRLAIGALIDSQGERMVFADRLGGNTYLLEGSEFTNFVAADTVPNDPEPYQYEAALPLGIQLPPLFWMPSMAAPS